MLKYILRRTLLMAPMMIAISIVAFVVIDLPPGDYLTYVVGQMQETGEDPAYIDARIEALERRFGFGQPLHVKYVKWVSGIILRGDFGDSFQADQPVTELIWQRLGRTLMISLCSMLFVWVVAFPIGVYSAVKQYSPGDYVASFLGFIGMATPNFMLALIMMYISFKYFGKSMGGLFSSEFMDAPWSWAKLLDLLSHLWVPVVVLGTGGTAGSIRIMRANLLDELHKPYVVAARATGVPERRLLFKYPVRVALNPFIGTIGWSLPGLVSGAAITSIVLNLPTTGPLLLGSLLQQDMYLAGSFILMLSVLTLIGTLISDIALAALDPRIRYDAR